MKRVVLGLGTNLGDRREICAQRSRRFRICRNGGRKCFFRVADRAV